MPNFKNSIIYLISDKERELYYIGSTTQKLSVRIAEHRRDVKNKKKKNLSSKKIFEFNKFPQYETLEYFECVNRIDLLKRERFYIELFKEKYGDKVINKCIPSRTAMEWYYDNVGSVAARTKLYRLNNCRKEEMKLYYIKNKQREKLKYKWYCSFNTVFKDWGKSNNLLDIKL